MIELREKIVLVTGANGFLGRHVVAALRAKGALVLAPNRQQLPLLCEGEIYPYLLRTHPEIVVHLAATVGGIGANRAEPGRFFYENLKMGMALIHACSVYQQAGRTLSKFLLAGTTCSYPKHPPHIPFKEEDLWEGYPEETNAPYGIAKRALISMLQAYRDQYQFPGICAILANLYGPGDHDDPERSHVIPALFRKLIEAKIQGQKSISIWGTGKPTREFLWVEDAADGLLRALELYEDPLPINLGGFGEISISDLVAQMAEIVGYRGEVCYDPSKPDGQPRRSLDRSRADRLLHWRPQMTLRDGLEQTLASIQIPY